jgi:hypothetical protein
MTNGFVNACKCAGKALSLSSKDYDIAGAIGGRKLNVNASGLEQFIQVRSTRAAEKLVLALVNRYRQFTTRLFLETCGD